MIVNGLLLALSAFFEAVILADAPLFGVVPSLTILAIIWLGRRAQNPQNVIIYGVLAGCVLDIFRPAYSPWLLLAGTGCGIVAWAWFQAIGLRQRLSPHYTESILIPLVACYTFYNGLMVAVYGLQVSLLYTILSTILQLTLVVFVSAAGWVLEGRMAQT